MPQIRTELLRRTALQLMQDPETGFARDEVASGHPLPLHGGCLHPHEAAFQVRFPRRFLRWVAKRTDMHWSADGQWLLPSHDYEEPELAFHPIGQVGENKGEYHFFSCLFACRTCEPCRKARRRQWAARAFEECQSARRTWFCTFTLKPKVRRELLLDCNARNALTNLGMAQYALGLFQKYMKRVRYHTNLNIRFLVSCEFHQDGTPHLHALIHETDKVKAALTYRQLKAPWEHIGFVKFNLVHAHDSPKEVGYVCKYLVKQDYSPRTRCSLRYGRLRSNQPSLFEK